MGHRRLDGQRGAAFGVTMRKWFLLGAIAFGAGVVGFCLGWGPSYRRPSQQAVSSAHSPSAGKSTLRSIASELQGQSGAPSKHSSTEPLSHTPRYPPPADPKVTIESIQREIAEVANRLIERYPNDPRAFTVAARERAIAGRTVEAMERFQKCLQLNPGAAEAYYGMARLEAQKGNTQRALDLMNKAFRLDPALGEDPALAEADRVFAQELMNAGRIAEAAEVLEARIARASRPSAREAKTYVLLGQAYLQSDQWEKAKRALETAATLDPEDPRVHYGLAACFARLGQTETARRHQERFRSLQAKEDAADRDSLRVRDDLATLREYAAMVLLSAGNVYLMHDDMRQAEEHWLRAAVLDPTQVPCRQALLYLYSQENRRQEALRVREDLRRLESGGSPEPAGPSPSTTNP